MANRSREVPNISVLKVMEGNETKIGKACSIKQGKNGNLKKDDE